MMAQQQIAYELRRLFGSPRLWAHDSRRLVFWYDPQATFADIVDALELSVEVLGEVLEVSVYTLKQRPLFEKYHLLHEHPQQHFLLYAPFERPADEDNWLLDLELSGLAFSADRAALLFRELGLHQRSLETFLRQHLSFFDDPKREARLLAMHLPADSDQAALRLAMMCAALGLQTADEQGLLRRLLIAGLESSANRHWQTLLALFAEQELWEVVAQALAFRATEPSLRRLYISLAVTHAARHLAAATPVAWRAVVLERPAAAYVFVDNWLKHRDDASAWRDLSAEIADDLRLEEISEGLEPETYARVDTFKHFDRALIRAVVSRLLGQSSDYASLRDWLAKRKTGFWYNDYQHYYLALEAAMDFLEQHQQLQLEAGVDCAALFQRYSQELYRLDGAYRRYVVARDAAGGDIIKALDDLLEGRYVRGWLEPLAQAWSQAFIAQSLQQDSAQSAASAAHNCQWQVPNVAYQWQFFERTLRPYLRSHEREKVFVIISDALRYEVAAELRDVLALDLRGDAKLTPLLGVLPSRTNVGMAALLPGKHISISPQNLVSKDGMSTQGKEARATLLQRSGFHSVVLSAPELLHMPRKEGREATKAAQLVVIYHDTIDKMGENDESKVLAACTEAVVELHTLIKRICNDLNGTNLYLTSDHGFLYQRRVLEPADKIDAPPKDACFESKRRHVLIAAEQPQQHAPLGSLGFRLPYLRRSAGSTDDAASDVASDIASGVDSSTASQDAALGDWYVYVPRGIERYALQGGGGQYVHGGSSLQEVTVPLLHYKHVRPVKGGEGASRKVNAQVITSSRRVTNTLFSVTVLQLDAVGGRVRPRKVRLALYDATGKAVTNEAALHLDKSSAQATEREQSVALTVGSRNLERGGHYDLVMTDSEDGTEVLREAWTISLAFTDDFEDF